MPLIIPLVPSVPFYRFSADIYGTEYGFNVRWNTRDAAWYLDLSERDGTPIANGLKLVLGTHIGRTVAHPLFTHGALVARDLSRQKKDATIDDMGTRIIIIYYTDAEIAAELRINSFVGGAHVSTD